MLYATPHQNRALITPGADSMQTAAGAEAPLHPNTLWTWALVWEVPTRAHEGPGRALAASTPQSSLTICCASSEGRACCQPADGHTAWTSPPQHPQRSSGNLHGAAASLEQRDRDAEYPFSAQFPRETACRSSPNPSREVPGDEGLLQQWERDGQKDKEALRGSNPHAAAAAAALGAADFRKLSARAPHFQTHPHIFGARPVLHRTELLPRKALPKAAPSHHHHPPPPLLPLLASSSKPAASEEGSTATAEATLQPVCGSGVQIAAGLWQRVKHITHKMPRSHHHPHRRPPHCQLLGAGLP